MGMWDMPARHYITDTELRFNPYHDPQNGRFTTAGGGSGGGFLYSKGGKSAYVFERDIDSEYEQWKKSKERSARTGFNDKTFLINGVEGAAFSSWSEVSKSSKNIIWTDGNVHALFTIPDGGSIQVKGDKKDKFALLNSVNTAIIHTRGINPNNYTKREVTKLNKTISEIKKMGFDTPKINCSRDETLIYAKRNRFTKAF